MIDGWWSVALAAAAFAAAAAALGVPALRALRSLRAEAAAARTRHHELCEGFSELAAANAALRRQLLEIGERVGRSDPVDGAAGGRAYDLAARLASGGASPMELVATCGLTPAEANLAVLVHGARAGARATH